MPRTIETTVYQFDELSERAKERARDWYRSGVCWSWSEEWWDSAQAFSQIAPIKITEADYNRAHVSYRWTGDDDVANLEGVRAWKWLHNNGWFEWAAREKTGACTLTGYCGDAPFADPLIDDYLHHPARVPDLKQVFYEMAQSWVREAQSDMEYCYSDESVDENIRANEYEFTEQGDRA